MAVLKTVQSGTTTIATLTASNTATITSVTTTKSLLFFSCSSNTNGSQPADFQIQGELTNATTLTFSRNSAAAVPVITVKWFVVEWSSGVTVQRGILSNGATGTDDVTITAVVVANSFPAVSQKISGSTWNGNDVFTAELTSTTNLQIVLSAAANDTMAWQVAESTSLSVQTITVTAFASASTTATITSVNTAKSLIVNTCRENTGSTTINNGMIALCKFNSATQIQLDRNDTLSFNHKIHICEWSDTTIVGSYVESGITTATRNTTITSVDTTKACIVTASNLNTYTGYLATPNTNMDDANTMHEFTSSTNVLSTREGTGSYTFRFQVMSFPAAVTTGAAFLLKMI